MFKEVLLNKINSFFPGFSIKFKDESSLMKFLGKIMFFNKKFMTSYTTTLGKTIYYPTRNFVDKSPVTSLIILLHELVHVHDAKKYSMFLFSLAYLFPQWLAIMVLPLFLIGLKLFALIPLLFLLPIPSPFRMIFERRAYIVSLYVMMKLNQKEGFNINLEEQAKNFQEQFKNSAYYFMWLLPLEKSFADALEKIKAGERPYQDDIFDILDEIIAVS